MCKAISHLPFLCPLTTWFHCPFRFCTQQCLHLLCQAYFIFSMDSLQEKKTNIHVKINEWSEINTLLHLNQVHVSELHWAHIPVLSWDIISVCVIKESQGTIVMPCVRLANTALFTDLQPWFVIVQVLLCPFTVWECRHYYQGSAVYFKSSYE